MTFDLNHNERSRIGRRSAGLGLVVYLSVLTAGLVQANDSIDKDWNVVTSVAVTNDSKTLAIARYSPAEPSRYRIELWSTSKWERLGVLATNGIVETLGFSQDGKRLASGAAAKTDVLIETWNVPQRTRDASFVIHEAGKSYSASFSKNNDKVVVGTADCKSVVLTKGDESQWQIIKGKAACFLNLTDRMLAGCCEGECLQVWRNGALEAKIEPNGNSDRTAVRLLLSSDESHAIMVNGSKTATVWSLKDRKFVRRFDRHSDLVISAAISHDGRIAATGGLDGEVRLWDTGSGAELAMWKYPGSVDGLAFVDSASAVAIGGGTTLEESHGPTPVVIWHFKTQERLSLNADGSARK